MGSEENGSLVSLGVLAAIKDNIVRIFWLRVHLVISRTEGSKRRSRGYGVSEVLATPFGSSFDGPCSRYCLSISYRYCSFYGIIDHTSDNDKTEIVKIHQCLSSIFLRYLSSRTCLPHFEFTFTLSSFQFIPSFFFLSFLS